MRATGQAPKLVSDNYSKIPEIPDIVLVQQQARQKKTRENTYPLLIRTENAVPALGRAAGASLFATTLSDREEM
jgi:hypothetical protein